MLSHFSDMRWLRIVFLFCALPTGLAFAFITPIGQVADEPAHIARVGALLHGQIIGERRPGPDGLVAGFHVDGGLIMASLSEIPADRASQILGGTATGMASPIIPVAVPNAQRIRAESLPWLNQQQFDVAPGSISYFPTFYIPGAIGVECAKLSGLGPLTALYVGRVFMLAAFLAMGYVAISIAKFGHGLFFTILCLPMTLSLAASYNQDGLLIATTTLVCSLLTRDPCDDVSCRRFALPLVALIIASKLPYACFLLFACIPIRKQNYFNQVKQICFFSLLLFVWFFVTMHYLAVAMPRDPYHPGIFWPGDQRIFLHSTNAFDNVKVLLANPILIPILPIAIFFEPGLLYFKEMVGVFGWLTVHLSFDIYIFWFIALFCAVLSVIFGNRNAGLRWTKIDAVLVGLGLYLTILLIGLAIYISWTNVGLPRVEGSQGRYYLLLIPFLAFIFPKIGDYNNLQKVNYTKLVEFTLLMPAVFMSLIDVYYLPRILMHVFL